MTPQERAEKREEMVVGLMDLGKTREQAEATLEFMGYALNRRFGDAEPMPEKEKAELLEKAFGPKSSDVAKDAGAS